MKFWMKIRYLRHPYLIWRTLLRPLEEWDSKRHILRLREYDDYSMSLEEATWLLFGVEVAEVVRLRKQLEDQFLKHIESCMNQISSYCGSMAGEFGLMLYIVVKLLRPAVVVETGVAKGISTSFILKALNENNLGRLYSVDLHYREGVAVPLGRKLGWVVPRELRDRWSLLLGESMKVLPKLMNKVGCIDIFLHDSRHLYKTMMDEYSIAWPHLRKGGVLFSDDVIENDAFIDFADKVKVHPVVVGRVGAIRKTTVDVENSSRSSI